MASAMPPTADSIQAPQSRPRAKPKGPAKTTTFVIPKYCHPERSRGTLRFPFPLGLATVRRFDPVPGANQHPPQLPLTPRNPRSTFLLPPDVGPRSSSVKNGFESQEDRF